MINLKNNLTAILLSAILIVALYNTYNIHKTKQLLASNTLVLTDSINSLSLDTSGKIDALNKKTDSITKQTNTIVEKQVISYVQKDSSDDADVEIKTEKPIVSVKVNDGPKYDFNLLPNETSKMENGKLVVNQGFSMNMDIKTKEYERSKWGLTTAINSDKNMLYGLHYDIGHSVAASAFIGQNMKPYYGLTYRIGGHQ